jgi:hypothetical protein
VIVYREWIVQKDPNVKAWDKNPYKFSGYFLFNFIPLYIRRIGY